jgi:hypothetical protein
MRLMLKRLFLPLLVMLLAGCASNYYNVPRETYEKKVKVLGVAPIFLDADSEIRHPEKAEVLKIVREANRKNEKELVDILKGNGEYFAVRFLDEEPSQLFSALSSRRERRDDAGVQYNKYFYKPEELKKFIERNNVDAVMLVAVSGIMMNEKIYSNNFMAVLDDNYNNMIMTAQIFDAEGTLLWEYPNFRQRFNNYTPMFALQYPDFEEARANLTDAVRIKNKSVAGIGRAFAKTESSSVKWSKQVSSLYNKQFSDMTAFLQYFRNPFADGREDRKPAAAEAAPTREELQTMRPAPAPAADPAYQPPPQTPLAPAAVPGKPAPREFEPVKPLEPSPKQLETAPVKEIEPAPVRTEVIRELDVK